MNRVLAEWDGSGEGQNVLLSIDPDQRKTGGLILHVVVGQKFWAGR
jgi:hypothetical protein